MENILRNFFLRRIDEKTHSLIENNVSQIKVSENRTEKGYIKIDYEKAGDICSFQKGTNVITGAETEKDKIAAGR